MALITRVEACELLDVSTMSLDRYIKQNKLPAFINKNRNFLLKKNGSISNKTRSR
ncbi:TPA_asm: hypothetical protein GYQ42_15135 [Listeria monocytogenes]|nr:hypothetical protein [Listeria monocytogenes]EDN7386419.1 hypothetical protein [Listeria monocytogenes]EDN7851874.1 hypothetical protein [Listeria monocytogenes]EDN7855065.1 hypothetical protein [Listeria monocytogenes]EDN7864558.1 hypothetical protein [Listeria monocytogenes]